MEASLYGDNAEQASPRAVRTLLRSFGGLTPTKVPMWRLVKAGDCRILCQGTMHHFPRGVDLDWSMLPARIEGGRFLLPRYRDIAAHRWILQKWFPPWIWGSAADWKAHRAEDGNTPLFSQEFPAAGDYYMLAGPWETVDEAGDLRRPILEFMRRERLKSRNLETMVAAMMAEETEEHRQKLEWLEREIMRAELAMDPIWKSTGLAAQQVRNAASAAMGIEGHFGAGEAWG